VEIERLNPPGLAFEGMSQAVAFGGLVIVSGQVALKDGRPVGAGDPAAQAKLCFENLRAALAEAGAGLADVVMLRCYLTEETSYPAYAAVKNRLFRDHPPCGTAVVVKALLLPEVLMEVEAFAVRRAGSR
jgi:2-iminobutanoate/2-iminopropanoate deaminase